LWVNGKEEGQVVRFYQTGGQGSVGSGTFVAKLNAGTNTVRFATVDRVLANPPQIDRLEVTSIRSMKAELYASLVAVADHISGKDTLNANQWGVYKASIEDNLAVLVEGERGLVDLCLKIIRDYESAYGPHFVNPLGSIVRRVDRDSLVPDVETTAFSIMQGVFDHVYGRNENVERHLEVIDGFRFETSEYFAGRVTDTPDPSAVHTVEVNASYPDPYGPDIIGDEKPARKPTGLYVAPGSIATVTVPPAMVGKGIVLRVGAHDYDLRDRNKIGRFDRVSAAYPIDKQTMKAANPFGGGIYLDIPKGVGEGVQSIQVKNVVRAPFFSMLGHRTTSAAEWRNEIRGYGAPWADFQTQEFQIQVPTSFVYAVDDPEKILDDWKTALNVVSDLVGQPRVRGKELLYMQVDAINRLSVFGAGYPQVNWSVDLGLPLDQYGGRHAEFQKGPLSRLSSSTFHELGHSVLGRFDHMFPGENETVVNVLYAAVLNAGFNYGMNAAFRGSQGKDNETYKTLDTTAITWMVCQNFRQQQTMTKLEMKYQPKGHAKYIDVARLFGWEALNRYWQTWLDDDVNGVAHDDSSDGRILRLAKAVGVDVTPLLQFWGVQPMNPAELARRITAAGLPSSQAIRDTLVHYREIIPASNAEFRAHALAWWGEEPNNSDPTRFVTEYEHDILFETYSASYAGELRAVVQGIIDRYF
jgi:hypothetical protein